MNDVNRASRTIRFTLNGRPVTAEVEPHENLVEVLQTQFALLGARESCGQGLCGCCTVVVDGGPVSGCLYLAAFADGADVETIESLADGQARSGAGGVHRRRRVPVRFLHARLRHDDDAAARPTIPIPSDDEIRHYLSGNLMPLRRLSRDHQCGQNGRTEVQGRINRSNLT